MREMATVLLCFTENSSGDSRSNGHEEHHTTAEVLSHGDSPRLGNTEGALRDVANGKAMGPDSYLLDSSSFLWLGSLR